jgi:hypothetical protein
MFHTLVTSSTARTALGLAARLFDRSFFFDEAPPASTPASRSEEQVYSLGNISSSIRISVLLVAYIAGTRLYRKVRLCAPFLGDALLSCQRSGLSVLCAIGFSSVPTIHCLLSHDLSTRSITTCVWGRRPFFAKSRAISVNNSS